MSKRKQRESYGVAAVRKRLIGITDLALEGSILAIDPSCISSSSVPGYAWYEQGKLTESGTITGIAPTQPLEKRLQFIGKYCREQFYEPDILVIEHISSSGRFSGMESLLRSTGAIISSFECEHVISISPLAWQAATIKFMNLIGKNDYEKYKDYKKNHKSDEEDAKWMGRMIIELAKGIK
jgi:hypothetical protein